MFRLNLKIALRNLWKNKGFSLINIGGLAIGLASCMLLLLYVAYEFSYDKQFKNYNTTYVAYNSLDANGKIVSLAMTPGVLAPELKQKYPDVVDVSRSTYPNEQLFSYGAKKIKSKAVFADPSFLKILDYEFLSGNTTNPLANINSVVLTQTLAKKLFGTENPIGRIVKLDNNDGLKVEAVMADLPENSSIRFEYMMPWKLYEQHEPWTTEEGWGSNFCLTLIQLKSNGILDQFNGSIKDMYQRHGKNLKPVLFLHPICQMAFI